MQLVLTELFHNPSQIVDGQMYVVGEVPGFYEFNRMTKVSKTSFALSGPMICGSPISLAQQSVLIDVDVLRSVLMLFKIPEIEYLLADIHFRYCFNIQASGCGHCDHHRGYLFKFAQSNNTICLIEETFE